MRLLSKIKTIFSENSKKNAFLTGALVLAVAGLVCRLLGVIFRIPLANIVGSFGMGIHQMVYPLYSLLLIISSAGVPIAISKMVAKEKVNGDTKQCGKILLNSLVMLGGIGLVVSALFAGLCHPIAKLQGNGGVWVVYLAIAPSVFIVCLIAAFRGYFQGLQNMVPTAVSQIIEQLVKVAIGLTLASVLVEHGIIWAVFGAIVAVTIAESLALLFLIFTYLRTRKKMKVKDEKNLSRFTFHVSRKLMWDIIKQSFPITLMASVFPLILVFDSMVVINMLKSAGESGEAAIQLYGISSGVVHALVNLPAVLGVAMGTAVVPTIASLYKQKKTDEMRIKSALAVKIIFLISIFFMLFFLIFPAGTIDLLFHGAFRDNPAHFAVAVNLMRIEAAAILFMGLTSVFSSMLQGIDKSRFPLIALGSGGVVKIAFELALIKTKMGIYSVAAGNVLCFVVAAILNIIFALRYIKIEKKLLKDWWRVIILVLTYGSGLAGLYIILPASRWWIFLAGIIAVIGYGLLIWALKFFSEKKVFSAASVGNTSKQEETS